LATYRLARAAQRIPPTWPPGPDAHGPRPVDRAYCVPFFETSSHEFAALLPISTVSPEKGP